MRFHAHVVEYVSQLPGVDAAVVCDILLAALVNVKVANLTLEALTNQPVEEASTVVAEREPVVVLHREPMWNVDFEAHPLESLQRED